MSLHTFLSQVTPRRFAKPKGFTVSNIQNGAAQLAKFYEMSAKITYPNLSKNNHELAEIIISKVCDYLGIEAQLLHEKGRKRTTVEARQISCYLIRRLTSLSLKQIADIFRQDHTTCIHAIRAVENEWRNNLAYRFKVNAIENLIYK